MPLVESEVVKITLKCLYINPNCMQNLFEIHIQGSFRGHFNYPAWIWLATIQVGSGELVELTTRTHSQMRPESSWSCCSVYTSTIWRLGRLTWKEPAAVYNLRFGLYSTTIWCLGRHHLETTSCLFVQSEVPATDPTTIWGPSPLSGVRLTPHSSADKSTSKTV